MLRSSLTLPVVLRALSVVAVWLSVSLATMYAIYTWQERGTASLDPLAPLVELQSMDATTLHTSSRAMATGQRRYTIRTPAAMPLDATFDQSATQP